jgi:hypothetical protein
MALRAAAMSPADISPRIRKPRHLMRKLVLLVLLTSAYALGLVLLLMKVAWFPLILFSYFADCTVAVVSGFGTRLLLSKRNWFIRTMIASLLPLIGLAVLGYFSDWKIGIDVIALSVGYVSRQDLTHLVLGITASWAALWAWYRPAARDEEPSTNDEPVHPVVIPEPRHTRIPRSWSLQPRLRIGTGADTHSGNGSRPSVRARLRLVTRQPARSNHRSPLAGRAHVQLALVEEHRCPYCLEPVSRTDPGGVKECEVCHSLHHADCWAITGMCQVPHLNT